ncbi:unnamed protein product [Phytomonas sp. Hart1]|nr:unnamed protein product [Phytomonas sp. Hart1]|eukprot:CCW67850.1 unnamed protein product [Phytomonas sp. isolate Hart1]
MDKYSKIRNIGKGTMGACALALNNIDGHYYVIKQVDLRRMSKKERRQGLNEARLLSHLRHPNIIDYVDSFLAKKSDHLCIVMEYAEGGDLKSRIKSRCGNNFSENQVLDWFIQLVLSLHYVHQLKILHRDVKTQNVFLTSEDIIKLGDFGIARTLNGTYDQAQTFVGTPYYLSPELLLERPYDHRSDVWALGVVLYEMLTLKQPFSASDMKGLMQRILKVKYDPISTVYSLELRNIVKQLLMKDPSQRLKLSDVLELPIVQKRLRAWLQDNVLPAKYVESLLKRNLLPESMMRASPRAQTPIGASKSCTSPEDGSGDSTEARILPPIMAQSPSFEVSPQKLNHGVAVSAEMRSISEAPKCVSSNVEEPDDRKGKANNIPQPSISLPTFVNKLSGSPTTQPIRNRVNPTSHNTDPPQCNPNSLDGLYHELLHYQRRSRKEPQQTPSSQQQRVLGDIGRLRDSRRVGSNGSPWYLPTQPLMYPKSSPTPISANIDGDTSSAKLTGTPQHISTNLLQNQITGKKSNNVAQVVSLKRLNPLFWPSYDKKMNNNPEKRAPLEPLYPNPPVSRPNIDIKALLQKAALERAQRRLKGAF